MACSFSCFFRAARAGVYTHADAAAWNAHAGAHGAPVQGLAVRHTRVYQALGPRRALLRTDLATADDELCHRGHQHHRGHRGVHHRNRDARVDQGLVSSFGAQARQVRRDARARSRRVAAAQGRQVCDRGPRQVNGADVVPAVAQQVRSAVGPTTGDGDARRSDAPDEEEEQDDDDDHARGSPQLLGRRPRPPPLRAHREDGGERPGQGLRLGTRENAPRDPPLPSSLSLTTTTHPETLPLPPTPPRPPRPLSRGVTGARVRRPAHELRSARHPAAAEPPADEQGRLGVPRGRARARAAGRPRSTPR